MRNGMAVCCALFSMAAMAEVPNKAASPDIKGLRLGMNAEAVRNVYGVADCHDSTAAVNKGLGASFCMIEGASFAGQDAKITVLLLDDRTISVQVSAASERFDDIGAALVSRYGAPKRAETPTVQNHMGATFTGKTLTWEFAGGVSIVADKFGDSITESTVVLTSTSGLTEFDKRKKERNRAAADDT